MHLICMCQVHEQKYKRANENPCREPVLVSGRDFLEECLWLFQRMAEMGAMFCSCQPKGLRVTLSQCGSGAAPQVPLAGQLSGRLR